MHFQGSLFQFIIFAVKNNRKSFSKQFKVSETFHQLACGQVFAQSQ